jgi:hypothetical protein
MTPITIAYEITDDMAARASRENVRAFGRKLFTPGLLVLTAIATAIFAVGLGQGAHGIVLAISGACPLLFAALLIGWLGLLWWAPRFARRRLAHFPHRRMVVEVTDSQLIVQSALARVAVDWAELKEVRELPNFWMLTFRSEGEMAIPRAVVPAEAAEAFRNYISVR